MAVNQDVPPRRIPTAEEYAKDWDTVTEELTNYLRELHDFDFQEGDSVIPAEDQLECGNRYKNYEPAANVPWMPIFWLRNDGLVIPTFQWLDEEGQVITSARLTLWEVVGQDPQIHGLQIYLMIGTKGMGLDFSLGIKGWDQQSMYRNDTAIYSTFSRGLASKQNEILYRTEICWYGISMTNAFDFVVDPNIPYPSKTLSIYALCYPWAAVWVTNNFTKKAYPSRPRALSELNQNETTNTVAALGVTLYMPAYSQGDLVKSQIERRIRAALITSSYDPPSLDTIELVIGGLKNSSLNQYPSGNAVIGQTISINCHLQYHRFLKANEIATMDEIKAVWAMSDLAEHLYSQLPMIYRNYHSTTGLFAAETLGLMKDVLINMKGAFEKDVQSFGAVAKDFMDYPYLGCVSTQGVKYQVSSWPICAYVALKYQTTLMAEEKDAKNWAAYKVEEIGNHINPTTNRQPAAIVAKLLPPPTIQILATLCSGTAPSSLETISDLKDPKMRTAIMNYMISHNMTGEWLDREKAATMKETLAPLYNQLRTTLLERLTKALNSALEQSWSAPQTPETHARRAQLHSTKARLEGQIISSLTPDAFEGIENMNIVGEKVNALRELFSTISSDITRSLSMTE